MTVSPRGVSTSVGVRGARVTLGSSGRVTRTIGIPGSGLSYTETIRSSPSKRSVHSERQTPLRTNSSQAIPGLFAPSAEKKLFKAMKDNSQESLESVLAFEEAYVCSSILVAIKYVESKNYPSAIERLLPLLNQARSIDLDPLFQKYLAGKGFEVSIAEGVTAELPLSSDVVGLLCAELLQTQARFDEAISIVERLTPTQTTALSLADLYWYQKKWDDIIEVSNGIGNVDDQTCLLLVYRGIAFREKGFNEAARENFKEALKSKKRNMGIRHRAHGERALAYMNDGKKALALKDVEKIMAENPDDPGVKLILDSLESVDNSPGHHADISEVENSLVDASENELPDADWYEDPLRRHELRFWDGTNWTEFVSDNSTQSEDPL